jgi:hypothetical protein
MSTLSRVAAAIGASVGLAISGLSLAAPAQAYGGAGAMGIYQVGLSFNCDKGDCGGGYGGFWGWLEFDSPANDPTAGTGGDAELAGCGHGDGFSGAGHTVMDIHDWSVQIDPDMGIPVFYASWHEVDTFRGQTQTFDYTDANTGIPAITVHRPLLEMFGIPTPPGQSINVQVAWKPRH